MGGSSSSSRSRPSDKQVGSCCATFGCVLAATALFLNQIIGFYDDKDATDEFGFCGWDGLRVESDANYAIVSYAYCCEDNTLCTATLLSAALSVATLSDFTLPDVEGKDFCDVEAGGIAWLALGSLGLILALVAIGAVAFQREHLSKFGEIGACLCAGGACAAFYINNNVCWNDDRVDDEQQRLGASMYLMIFAAACFGLGAFCSAR